LPFIVWLVFVVRRSSFVANGCWLSLSFVLSSFVVAIAVAITLLSSLSSLERLQRHCDALRNIDAHSLTYFRSSPAAWRRSHAELLPTANSKRIEEWKAGASASNIL